MFMSPLFQKIVDFFAFSTPEAKIGIPLAAAVLFYLGWTALGLAANLVAPPAENHSTARRLVALAILVGCAIFAAFQVLSEHSRSVPGTGNALTTACFSTPVWLKFIHPLLLTCLAPAIAIALTEQTRLVPSACKPFARFGWFGRAAGRFLYPGWPSGVWFTGLLGLLLALFLGYNDHNYSLDTEELLAISSWFGSLLFPAVLLIPFARKLKSMIATYILIGFASSIFGGLLAILAGVMGVSHSGFLWFFFWLPQIHLPLSAYDRSAPPETVLSLSIFWNFLLFLALFVFSMAHQKSIARAEREAMTHNKNDNPQPTTSQRPMTNDQ
jgi:hypothetical protein